MAAGKTVGRPPRYKTREEIEEKIEAYFQYCEGEPLLDSKGEVVLDKCGMVVMIHQHPPTMAGLALALGFTSRQALLNYKAKKEFVDSITRAKSMVEQYTEERLFDRNGVNGARFSLVNNFRGWSERPQSDDDRKEQQIRIEKMQAETAAAKSRIGQGDNDTAADDGFVDALRASAPADWGAGGETDDETDGI